MQNLLSLATRSIDRANVTGRTANRVSHMYRNVTRRAVRRNLSLEFQNINVTPRRRMSDENVARSPAVDRPTPITTNYKHERPPYLEHVGLNGASLPYEQTTCVICLCEFSSRDASVKTICDHVFHENCIGRWFAREKSCPTCRKRV